VVAFSINTQLQLVRGLLMLLNCFNSLCRYDKSKHWNGSEHPRLGDTEL